MRGAAAQLEAMLQASSWQQSPQHFFDKDSSVSLISSSSSSSLSSSSSSSSSSSPSSLSTLPSSTPLLPFSSFFTSSLSLLDDPSLTEALPALMEDALEDDVPSFPEEDQIPLYPPASLFPLPTTSFTTTTSPTTTTLSLPPQESLVTHVPCCSSSSSSLVPMGVFGLDACSGESLGTRARPSAAAGGDADGRQRQLDELDKARRRQLKAEQRKERNKEAARRSNLNKKLIRDQLEKKSLELCEENLQLQQDIRDLSEKLRHFRHLHNSMHHVCRRKR